MSIPNNLPPVHQIEDSSLTGGMRMSKENGRRFHQRWLRNMYGCFLTLLNPEGKILFFAAGALRRRYDENCDRVTLMTTSDLVRGITGDAQNEGEERGGFQPEYQVLELHGEDRSKDWECRMTEVPFLSMFLGVTFPTAVSWGVLQVGVDPTKRMNGHLPNGQNLEEFLDDRNWRTNKMAGNVMGSGGNDLSQRLAPEALQIAQDYPSAWGLAMTSAYLFGGMTENLPTAEPISRSAVLGTMIDEETQIRRARKKALDEQRAMRIAQRQHRGSDPAAGLQQLRDAVTPQSVEALEAAVTPPPQEDSV